VTGGTWVGSARRNGECYYRQWTSRETASSGPRSSVTSASGSGRRESRPQISGCRRPSNGLSDLRAQVHHLAAAPRPFRIRVLRRVRDRNLNRRATLATPEKPLIDRQGFTKVGGHHAPAQGVAARGDPGQVSESHSVKRKSSVAGRSDDRVRVLPDCRVGLTGVRAMTAIPNRAPRDSSWVFSRRLP